MKFQPLKILIFGLALFLFACSSARIGWVDATRPGYIAYSYIFFTGTERRTIDLSNGEALKLNYQAAVKTGALTLTVEDPEGKVVWQRELMDNQSEEVEIPTGQAGPYTILTTGKNTRGSFDVEWAAVVSSAPKQVVEDFYNWYLDYVSDPVHPGNVLTDRAYRSSDSLTPEFVQQVDTLLASFERRGPGYDPFLCAQNVPPALVADDPIVSGGLVAVRVGYQSYAFTVHLTQVEDTWQIANIVCAFE